jgi:8-oxo-dGTP pyrophosphatase MutT (NUDIX family)
VQPPDLGIHPVLGATELPRSANILTSLRPPIFMQQMNNSLDLDLAFRICAIRETFEEIGILLGEQGILVDFKIVAGL